MSAEAKVINSDYGYMSSVLSAPERVCRAERIGLDPQRAEKKILYNGIERLFWIIQIILDFYIF